ncbi:MAG: NfeD family protein [Leptolyngbyaceae cyanobacterium]
MYILEQIPVEFFEQTMSGIVERDITAHLPGRVKVMGVSWKASLYDLDGSYILSPDTPVTVLGRRGNTLLVLPAATSDQ